MNSINDAFVNALLADAAYVHELPSGSSGAQLKALLSNRMTDSLADYIGQNFTVVTQIETDPTPLLGSSFDATIWRNNKSGKLYVSMRGTQQVEDFIVDADLALTGNAQAQLVDMVNWWLREITPAGQAARQVIWNSNEQEYEEASPATGTGEISAADLAGGIEVNGHSLGGYLASAFTRLFGKQANVQHTTTFNSAGFAPGSESAFRQLQSVIGVDFGIGHFPNQAEQTNFFAKNGINVTTNSFWFNQVGQRVQLFNEESANPVNNHFMYKLTDTLALADTLVKIDSSLDFSRLNSIIEAGANKTQNSLESVLDGFRKIFIGNNISPTPFGDAGDSPDSRTTYQNNILALDSAIQNIGGDLQIVALDQKSAISIASDAKANFGTLLSLQLELSFAVKGDGLAAILEGTQKSLYDSWSADQSLSAADRAAGKANFSDQWLSDRATMLSWVMYRNKYDYPTGQKILTNALINNTPDQWHFADGNTGISLDVGPFGSIQQPMQHAIVFGADGGSDTLRGAAGDSHLYAGADSAETLQAGSGNDYLEGGRGHSNDTLIGGAGHDTLVAGNGDSTLLIAGSGGDTLIGGAGLTTFQFATGDGEDIIVNATEQDKLVIDGVTLAGANAIAADNKIWRSLENPAITFTLIPDGSGQQDLQIKYGNHDGILVKDYVSGAFGITLQDYVSPTSPSSPPTGQPSNVINGDLNPINFGTDDNPRYQYDALGNLVTDPNSAAPGRDDTLFGSAGNDLINAGGGNNLIYGAQAGSAQGGDDTITAGDGNNVIHDGDGNNRVTVGNGANQIFLGNGANTLALGTGSAYVTVGDGNNQIEGNRGRDVIVAGNGNNAIFANKKIDLASAIANRDNLSASGHQGNLIAVGSGSNTIVSGPDNDLIVLGGGNDVVVLGPGNDTVVGGEAASQVYATWSAQSVMTDVVTGGQPSAGHFVSTTTQYQGLSTSSSGGYVPSAQLSAFLAQYPGIQQYNVDPYGNPVGIGNETIIAGSGNSVIGTSNGDCYVDAGSGNSLVYAGAGNDTIFAGTGNSTISGGGGDDYIDGESGNHLIAGGAGNNTIFGGSGNDTIYAGVAAGASTADINAGNNYVSIGSGNSIVYGSGGNDTILAGSGQDTIVAGNGNTVIYGGTGTDLIFGGSGTDLIYAGDGGTAAAPTAIIAGSGTTTIYGGLGVDSIQGGSGTNVIYAGDGGSAAQRTVVFAGSGDTTIYGGLGVDEIHGGSGKNVLYAGDGGTADAPTLVFAGTGNSTLYGGAGTDILVASASGNTLLVGGSGTETLLGSGGDDTLVAGTGSDILNGGAGSNTYVFNSGFGSSEITQIGGLETLQFGPGISVSDLTISAVQGANGAPALEILVGGSSVIIDGSFNGQAATVAFADGTTLSLTQLMAQATIAPTVISNTSDSSTVFEASGDVRTTRYAVDGTAISDSWQSVDGFVGADTFNVDGSSQGVAASANGSIRYTFNDGQGNTTAYTYDITNRLIGDSWSDSSGSSGTDTFNADGTSVGATANADGTTSAYTSDGQGNKVTKYYSATGALTGDAWIKADGTSGSDTFDSSGNVTAATTVAVDGSKTVQANDGQGDTSTTQYDSAGNKVSYVWQSADGSHGNGQLNNGAWVSVSYAIDGSYTQSTQDASGNTTAEQFSSAGVLIGTSWSHSDGTHGSTTLSSDGSSDSFTYNRGGSYSETKTDAVGNTTTAYYSSTGQLLYDTWHHVDGTSGANYPDGGAPDVAAHFKEHGVFASVSKDSFGNKTINIQGADGTQIYSIYEDKVYGGYGTSGGGYGGDGYGGGYGSPYASSMPVGILQVTPGANGIQELQEIGLSGHAAGVAGLVKNTEILADGSLFESSWVTGEYGISLGDRISTSYGSIPGSVFHTSHGGFVGASTAGHPPPLRSGGSVIIMPGGILLYSDGTQLVQISGIGYTGGPPLALTEETGGPYYLAEILELLRSMPNGGGVPPASNTNGTSQPAGGTYTVTYTYTGGGTEQVNFVNGIYASDTVTDGQGGSWSMNLTPPPGGHIYDYGTVSTQTATTDSGYTYTNTNLQDSSTEVYQNPNGSVAESNTFGDGVDAGVLYDQNGNAISTTFNRWDPSNPSQSSLLTTSVDRAGNVIHTTYRWTDVNLGELATSSWTTQDGTQISAVLDSTTDTYQVTSRYTDGTYSVVTSDAQGGYVDRNYDALGNLVSDQWQADNGDIGNDVIHINGSVDSAASYHLAHGIVESVTTTTQADGSYLRTWTKTDGSSGADTHNADGTGSGSAQFADGTHSTYTSTAQGVVTTLNYDASGSQVSYSSSSTDNAGNWLQTTYDLNGVKLSDQWVHTDGASGSDVFNADGTVETKASYTNAQGVVITADKITQPDGSFVQTWSGADGSTGTDVGKSDGSATGTSDSATAGHGTYTDDGHGNVAHSYVATANNQTLIGASAGVNTLQVDSPYSDEVLQGGAGNDTFILHSATGDYDEVDLGDGDNTVSGQDGDAGVFLGAGNNDVVLGNGDNSVGPNGPGTGGGSNSLYLGNGRNFVWLGDGNNTVGVGTGNNRLTVGNGNNTLYAGHGAGADIIKFGNGANTVTLGDGANTVNGGNGKNIIWGGNGNNQITVGGGDDTIGLGNGNNIVTAGDGASSVSVGDGTNRIRLGGGSNVVNAGAGANTIRGGNGNNAVYVGNGNNDVEFGDGNNTVGLGTGSSTVILGGGSNTVYSGQGTGSNSIFVGGGTNVVTVADGANYVGGGDGTDHVYGGNGSNTIQLGNGLDSVNVGDGANTIRIGDGDSAVYVGNGNNQITLGRGNDAVNAGNGSNTLTTGDGNSNIWMGTGNNTIQAGNGNNTIGVGSADGSTNTIQVGDGNNSIAVAAGTNDIRVGNGTDTVQTGNGVNTIHLGAGQVTLTNYGGQDTVNFASTVQDDQLWFAQDGIDLLVTVDGTSSNLRLTDWFNGATHATLVAGDGHQLIDSQVNSLVQAMAQFAPPAVGQTTLPQPQHDNLMPVIAASWR